MPHSPSKWVCSTHLESPQAPHYWDFVDVSSRVCVCVCVCALSHVQLFATPWTIALQAPLSMQFCRQEYWSGLPLPSPGDLPDPEMKAVSPVSPALAGGFISVNNYYLHF